MKKFVFAICSLLLVLSLGIAVSAETFQEGDMVYTYEITGENTVKLLSVTGVNPKAGFQIPRELDGYTVTAIGKGFLDAAVSSTDDLTSLFIPNTVTQIDSGFMNGVSLFHWNASKGQMLLELEEGNPVYSYIFVEETETGNLVEKESNRLIAIVERRSKVTTVAPGTEILSANALGGMDIHELWLPASLKQIEDGALDAAERIDFLTLEEGATAFTINGRRLLDADGNSVYPREEEPDPTESYTTAEGLTVTPMTQEEKQQLQEKERKDRWNNILGFGLAAVLIALVVLTVVQSIRGEGAMSLASLFEQPPLFFFDMVLCIGVLLLPKMLEEEAFWLTGNKLAVALTVIAMVMGVAGVIVEFLHAGGFWAIPRLLIKSFMLVALGAVSLTEGIFAWGVGLVVLWRAVTNAIRGVWSIFCGLGLAPVFEAMGNMADLMSETMSEFILPQEELSNMRYSDVSGTDRYFMGPKGIVHVREEAGSYMAKVKYDGRTFTAEKLPDGSLHLSEPLVKLERPPEPAPIGKVRKHLTPGQCVQFILIGAARFAPSLLIILQLIDTMY